MGLDVHVHQGIDNIRQCLQECAENLVDSNPSHRQYQFDTDTSALVSWCQWDGICECAHLGHPGSAAVIRICDVKF